MRKNMVILFILILVATLPTSVQAAQNPIERYLGQHVPLGSNEISLKSSEIDINRTSESVALANTSGMSLAWGVMLLMGVSLVVALVMIVRAFNGKPLSNPQGLLDYAIPILSILGLGASIYLTYVEITSSRALCGPVGDCNAVQSSPYAKLFGVLPIGLLGTIGYIAILATWGWRRFRTDSIARIAGPVMFAMALFGTLFSVYLTYLELFVIHAVCIWCISSAVIITALMLLSLPYITQWLAITDEEE